METQNPTSPMAHVAKKPAMIKGADASLSMKEFPHADAVGGDPEQRSVLRLWISQLPPHLRQVLLVVDVQGHSCAEAVHLLQLPMETIRTHLCRARVALRDRLVEAGQMPSRPR